MADVMLTIGGHQYSMSCADGEEAVLRELAAMVDDEISNARAALGNLTESRQLLFAALFLADKVKHAPALVDEPAHAAAEDDAIDPELIRDINLAAGRIAVLNDRLDELVSEGLES